jgi:hypothetical protein
MMSSERIRQLNDAFRTTFKGGKVLMTASVEELPAPVKAHALLMVGEFSTFTKDNDPHDEHDFGKFELVGRTFFWKIDYYDQQCECGSEDPSNPKITTRVMTLMLASDY